MKSPLEKDKSEFQPTYDRICLADSPVGIDPKLTHAIIIDYLQTLHARLDRIESALNLPPWSGQE
jgi:hypothetical protein